MKSLGHPSRNSRYQKTLPGCLDDALEEVLVLNEVMKDVVAAEPQLRPRQTVGQFCNLQVGGLIGVRAANHIPEIFRTLICVPITLSKEQNKYNDFAGFRTQRSVGVATVASFPHSRLFVRP